MVVACWIGGCRNPEPARPDAVADGPASLAANPDPASAEAPSMDATEAPRPAGSACLRPEDCESGICEGRGCSDDEPGTCMDRDRMCTRDSRQYCGCDGQTFRGSGSCPGARYAHEGECSADMDPPS